MSALLTLRRPWYRQPSELTGIAAHSPLARGLSDVFVANGSKTVLRSEPISLIDSAGFVGSAQGLALSVSSSALMGASISPDVEVLLRGGSVGTIAVLRRCRDTTARDSAIFGYATGGGAANTNRVLSHAPYSDGNLYFDFGNSTAGSGRVSVAFTKTTNWETLVFVAGPRVGREVWRNGVRIVNNASATASRTAVPGTPFYAGGTYYGVLGATKSDNIDMPLLMVATVEWTPGQIAEFTANPWGAFASRRIWVPVSASSTHTSSGALASDAATIAGTAAHLTLHTTSGALASDAAAITGAATHLTLHTTEGALASQAATIAGSAEYTEDGAAHATSGALASADAAIAGTASHLTLHSTTGALAADAAVVAGTAARLTLHTTTGALAAEAATMAGVAVHSGAGAEVRRNTGAGKSSKRRPRVVEINGKDVIVGSAEEAQALLDDLREEAKEAAALAVDRATKATRRPARKVLADARNALRIPEISAPGLEEYAEKVTADIQDLYRSAMATVEIAALLAKRQREEEDDEDVLLLLV